MADAITIKALQDASLDAKSLEEVVNGDDAKQVTTRLGETYPSAKKAIKTMFENGGLPAKPFATKAIMITDGAILADGAYAIVNDDIDDNNGLYLKNDGVWGITSYDPFKKFMSKFRELISNQNISEEYVAAFVDELGYMAVGIKPDGVVYAPKIQTDSFNAAEFSADALSFGDIVAARGIVAGYESVTVDTLGNIVMGIKTDGTVYIPKLKTDSNNTSVAATNYLDANTNNDTILMVGDSFTASGFAMQDKAYISNLSALTDYRFKNLAISGNDSLDMNNRIVRDIAFFDGLKPHQVQAKYAIICSYENDVYYRTDRLEYYLENMTRLIESVQALGIEPIIASQFNCRATDLAALKSLASSKGIRFIDATSLNTELGRLKIGLFHQGHPAVRTNAVFWLPMLEAINKLPKPKSSVKIFRKRNVFTANDKKDLLYKNTLERYKRFKELTVSHTRLSPERLPLYDEIGLPYSGSGSIPTNDEYISLGSTGLTFSDYGLVEIIVDGTSQTLDGVTINIDTDAQVYIRNFYDTSVLFVSKSGGGRPADADYQARWDDAGGDWKLQQEGQIKLDKKQLKGLMLGDKLQLLLHKVGGFTLNDVQINYVGEGKVERFIERNAIKVGEQLLIDNTFDELANWTTTGTPTTLVPIENRNSPRLPSDRTKPVNQVVTITDVDTVGQSIVLPKVNTSYRMTVWCRYFAKAFIDNSLGEYDATQVVDKSEGNVYPDNAPITSDTNDLRTLMLKYNLTDTFDDAKAAKVTDFACLGWRGVEFDIYVADAPLALGDLSFNLSCPDGEIQIAKIELTEIK